MNENMIVKPCSAKLIQVQMDKEMKDSSDCVYCTYITELEGIDFSLDNLRAVDNEGELAKG